MEWVIMNRNGVASIMSDLGCYISGEFIVSDEAEDSLRELLSLLKLSGDEVLRIQCCVAQKNLIATVWCPLLKNIPTKDTETGKTLFTLVISCLAYLTQDTQSQENPGTQQRLYSIVQDGLCQWKKMFEDIEVMKVIITYMNDLLSKDDIPEADDLYTLDVCLLLLRNVLYISPQDKVGGTHMDITILNLILQDIPDSELLVYSNALACGLGEIILRMTKSQHLEKWTTSLVQLVSLFYKHDVIQDTMSWVPGEVTDVSGSSNSSPYDTWPVMNSMQNSSADSLLGSLFKTSCSSDQCNSSRNNSSRNSAGVNCPYIELEQDMEGVIPSPSPVVPSSGENSLGISDGSDNENRNTTNGQFIHVPMAMPVPAIHTPLQQQSHQHLVGQPWILDQFSQSLHMFTRKFTKDGVRPLLDCLQLKLMRQPENSLLETYYLWTLPFFMSYALTYMSEDCVRNLLSVKLIGTVIGIGVLTCEELMITLQCRENITDLQRRQMLMLACLTEVFKAIRVISKSNTMGPEDAASWTKFKMDLVHMNDLRLLFVLLIRWCLPNVHSVLHMSSLIMLNHYYLVLMEEMRNNSEEGCHAMLDHIKNFATNRVMQVYNYVLDNFEENSNVLNDCVFTMMHHVAGDCNHPETLLQLNILNTFQKILDSPYCTLLSRESTELMDYIGQQFMEFTLRDPEGCAYAIYSVEPKAENSIEEQSTWPDDDSEELCQLYLELQDHHDLLGELERELNKRGMGYSKSQILGQLCLLDLLSPDKVKEIGKGLGTDQLLKLAQGGQVTMLPSNPADLPDFIKTLKPQYDKHLNWLQGVLMETCFSKLGGNQIHNGEAEYMEEPVTQQHVFRGQSVPVVPYTEAQEQVVKDPKFLHLLIQMGFHVAEDTNKIFPRIPSFWTVSDLMKKATLLGEVQPENCKFSVKDLKENSIKEHDTVIPDDVPGKASVVPENLWFMFVQQCNLHSGNPNKETQAMTSQA